MKRFPKTTSFEQAQFLCGLGIDPHSADMSYHDINPVSRAMGDTETYSIQLMTSDYDKAQLIYGKDNVFPCWSLPGLLALMPSEIKKGDVTYHLDFAPYKDKWGAGYFSTDGIKQIKGLTEPSDPISTCVEAISWLVGNGYPLNTIEKD